MKILVNSYISQRGAYFNNELKFNFREENWLKECYQLLKMDYPKFYKMDNLSKMAVLATELIKSEGVFNKIEDDEPELIFANANASQHTDMKFIESYEQTGNPSPSLFVYTLPNILTGELAIKNKWYGENTFFVTPEFNAVLFAERLHHSSQKGSKLCLCGWIDSKVNAENEIELEECFLFLVSLSKNDNKSSRSSFATELKERLEKYRN